MQGDVAAKRIAMATLLLIACSVGYAQPIAVSYTPNTIATDTAHCPTRLPQDSTKWPQYFRSCVEAWRNRGFLEASIDSIIYLTPTDLSLHAHLGPKYAIPQPPDNSTSHNYKNIPYHAASSFAQSKASSLAPNDRIAVQLTLQDSSLSIATTHSSASRNILIDIRQDGPLKIPMRTLYAMLHLRQNKSTIHQSNLPKIEKILAAIPYARTVHPPVIEYLTNNAILHVFLAPQKANTLQASLGFQPKPDAKGLLFYGNANIDLQSLFKQGERFLIEWQLLQPNYHQLNVKTEWNYIYGSQWGGTLSCAFNRQDSSQSQFSWGGSLRFFPAPFHLIEAGYSQHKLAHSKYSENLTEAKRSTARAYSYSLAYTFEKINYTTWPYGFALKAKTALTDRHADTSPHGIILDIFATGKATIPIGSHGLRLGGTVNYANKLIANQSRIDFFDIEQFRAGGANSIRGYLESSITTLHYASCSLDFAWCVNPWVMPHAFTDVGALFDAPNLRGVMSLGAGIALQALVGQLSIDVARGIALSQSSPRGDWILHVIAFFKF